MAVRSRVSIHFAAINCISSSHTTRVHKPLAHAFGPHTHTHTHILTPIAELCAVCVHESRFVNKVICLFHARTAAESAHDERARVKIMLFADVRMPVFPR